MAAAPQEHGSSNTTAALLCHNLLGQHNLLHCHNLLLYLNLLLNHNLLHYRSLPAQPALACATGNHGETTGGHGFPSGSWPR